MLQPQCPWFLTPHSLVPRPYTVCHPQVAAILSLHLQAFAHYVVTFSMISYAYKSVHIVQAFRVSFTAVTMRSTTYFTILSSVQKFKQTIVCFMLYLAGVTTKLTIPFAVTCAFQLNSLTKHCYMHKML